MQFVGFSNLCKLFNNFQTFLIVTAQFLFPEVYTLLFEVGAWLTINGEWWLAGWDRCLMTFSWRLIFLVCIARLDFPSLYCSFLRLLPKLHQTPCVLWLFPFLWPREYTFQENKKLPLLFTFIILWFKHMHKIGICWSHSLKRCRFSSRMMLEFTGNWIINFKLLFSKSHCIDCSACETACNGMHGEFWTVAGVYHIHLLNMLNTTIQVISSRTLF